MSLGAQCPVGRTVSGRTPGVVIGAFGLADGDDSEQERERIMRVIGIPEHAAQRCGIEVESGRILLYAEAEPDTNATSILRHAGASEVLH